MKGGLGRGSCCKRVTFTTRKRRIRMQRRRFRGRMQGGWQGGRMVLERNTEILRHPSGGSGMTTPLGLGTEELGAGAIPAVWEEGYRDPGRRAKEREQGFPLDGRCGQLEPRHA